MPRTTVGVDRAPTVRDQCRRWSNPLETMPILCFGCSVTRRTEPQPLTNIPPRPRSSVRSPSFLYFFPTPRTGTRVLDLHNFGPGKMQSG